MKLELQQLAKTIDGDFYDSQLAKTLYATDASVYRTLPLAVVLPKHTRDIRRLVQFANVHAVTLIPRAAGTSLAGQCVGNGIVVDISKYMNEVLEFNPKARWIRVQPGIVRDELNVFLKPYGLYFGPNTSTANRCTIGGMVGNNSCGSTSIVYGSTRDHVLELKTVLSDTTEVTFKSLTDAAFRQKLVLNTLEGQIYSTIKKELDTFEIAEEIKANYPKASISRRNTGYAMDALLDMRPFSAEGEAFNMCQLLAGSEGTLAFTTEIKLNLVSLPKPKDIVLNAHFSSIEESLKATVIAMKHQPTACELMDKTILDCTKDNIAQQRNRFFVKDDPQAILMIEFRADDDERAIGQAKQLIAAFEKEGLGYAFPIVKGEATNRVWDLRKAGLGLLANIPGDKKAVACIEDTAVAVTDLPSYISEFTQIMHDFGQEAVYYAHAGAGELHLRPILDLKTSEDVKLFREISKQSALLVKRYGGSLSGEHGDGRVRAEFIPLVLGEKNYELLKRIKQVWDPNTIFNKGKIVNALPMHTNLRYEPDVKTPEIQTAFNFEDTGGLLRTVEKCNGSGDCRKLNFAGGTMCPSYRVSRNEKDSTRGRANVLREFFTQNVKDDPFNHPEIKDALDLCISCKGCKSECPSNVDMATLKSEFQYQYYKRNKVPFRNKMIAYNNTLNGLASKFPKAHNFLIGQAWFKTMIGFEKQRSLPKIHQQTLKQWFANFKQKKQTEKIYFFCDEYTNYYDVPIGKKAIKLLNYLGYKVIILEHKESGRSYISKGFLDQAKAIAKHNVSLFKNVVSAETPLVGLEPSAILSFRDEYIKLLDKNEKSAALQLSKHVFLIEEFLSQEIRKGRITASQFSKEKKEIIVHGHCHQKALSSMSYTIEVLRTIASTSVSEIPSGCCGMAGAFGYEKEHYEFSNAIGNMVLFPKIKEAKKNTIVVANGTSCRHQIKDGTNVRALHPIEILYNAFVNKM
ncbi:MAG: FAD-binding protein [Flavobacteriaceae bacterium]|nr:FAD-binding protein [Flavobacteriaceae bacterium]